MSELFGKKAFRYMVILLLLADGVYTFKQHYGKPLDGDLVPIVLPSEHYSKVLTDPFGISALVNKERYAATNRYFSHISMQLWFKPVYKVASIFFHDKVTCLYTISALFSTLVNLLVILVLAKYVSVPDPRRFWVAVLLAIPLMQINGFENIRIIDNCISYTFFYAYPLSILLAWFFPFYKFAVTNNAEALSFSLAKHILWIALAMIISFSCSLIPPVILLTCPFILLNLWIINFKDGKNLSVMNRSIASVKNISPVILGHFLLVIFLCLYSYFIGTFNIENPVEMPSLSERYSLMISGLENHFTYSEAYMWIAFVVLVNVFLLYKQKLQPADKKVFSLFPAALLFCIAFTALLPFGGYREYRPFIIRNDTFMPVTFIVLFFMIFTITITMRSRSTIYMAGILILMIRFTYYDKPGFHNNKCEKYNLRMLSASERDTVVLNKDCTILSWDKLTYIEAARNNSLMLEQWGITRKPVWYYQE